MKMASNGFERTLVSNQPKTVVFGNGCAPKVVDDLYGMDFRRVLMLTAPPLAEAIEPLSEALRKNGLSVLILDWIEHEPTVKMFQEVLDAEKAGSDMETARQGIQILKQLCHDTGIPERLSKPGISFGDLDRMAAYAMTIERLLRNAMRKMTQNDAKEIYTRIFENRDTAV
jgi:alcohol dehydrogenase class IV